MLSLRYINEAQAAYKKEKAEYPSAQSLNERSIGRALPQERIYVSAISDCIGENDIPLFGLDLLDKHILFGAISVILH
jgi:hypothetical protein